MLVAAWLLALVAATILVAPARAAAALTDQSELVAPQTGSDAEQGSGRFGYSVRFVPVGPEHPQFGTPTQMGVFTK